MIRKWSKLLPAILFSLILSCNTASTTQSDDDTGSGSEVIGKAEYGETVSLENSGAGLAKPASAQLAMPVINAAVYLFPENFQVDIGKDPAEYVPKVRTDSVGRFKIKNVLKGVWVLEINDGNNASSGRKFKVTGKGEPVDLGIIMLQKPASLKCTIKTDLPGSTKIRYYLYVLGTRISASGTENDLTINLGGIPTGFTHSIKFVLIDPFSWNRTFHDVSLTPETVFNLKINLPSP